MLYLIILENLKELIFKLSTAIFGQLEHGHFSRLNLIGLFFDFEFFSMNFRCSKG